MFLWSLPEPVARRVSTPVCVLVASAEGKELQEDVVSQEISSLTKKQAAAVKKRVDTLNATLRKKQKQREKGGKADVRDLFSQGQVSQEGGASQGGGRSVRRGRSVWGQN